MIACLAQQPAPVGEVWKWTDLGPFAIGCATLLASFVAGWFLIRSNRKSPYDRLEQLSKARAEWPEDVPGRESLDHSIAYAMSQIRYLEANRVHVGLTRADLEADSEVAVALRKDGVASITVSSVCLAVVAGYFVFFKDGTDLGGRSVENWKDVVFWAIIIVAVGSLVGMFVTGAWQLMRSYRR
ncbi:hypothetical protein [Nocardia sp. NPDC005366]|uniref:hypothetical protein n=1 Tax=Nocardia sp. NPDC005366 TaxID=3156878 RepID=UPI0033AE2158